MAKIHSCTYCGGSVCDSPWHPTCRIEHLEDKLYEVHTEIVTSEGLTDPARAKLISITGTEKWRSKEESETKPTAEVNEQLKAVLQEGAETLFIKE